jgi:hypothetical protein
MAAALVTLMAAGVAYAQQTAPVEYMGEAPEYVPSGPRDSYVYEESTVGRYFFSPGNVSTPQFGAADDIRFGAPVSMTSFEVGWYSRITFSAAPLTMEVRFYNYFTDDYPFGPGTPWGMGTQYGPTFTITGLSTGRHMFGDLGPTVVTVDGPPVWLPCSVWMEVGFYDNTGAFAANTGWGLTADNVAETGISSNDYFSITSTPGNPWFGVPSGLFFWFGGYTPTLPQTDPNYNPMSNFQAGIYVPEPLTLGLVALGGLLAVRRRR